MENSLKGLILAAGTIITCVVISLGFYISNEAQATASSGASKIGQINNEFAESDKTVYDGRIVSGNEVISALSKFKDEKIGIRVTTKCDDTFYNYNFDINSGFLSSPSNSTYASDTSPSATNYINPYASFKGKVYRDNNNVITGIGFTQN